MDSCSSSPSHSFKDRPRSRHVEPTRQPSFPHNFERAKSPAPKGLPESKENLDLARRSYGAVSEKEGRDMLLSTPDRSRREKPFGFERIERSHDYKMEMYRSTRPRTPTPSSRNPDRDNSETGGGMLPSRRSSHGGDNPQKHEVYEGVSSSPLHGNERDYEFSKGSPEKGYVRGSLSPECDWDASRSPPSSKGYGFMRDSFKASPKRFGVVDRDGTIRQVRKDFGFEKERSSTPRSSPKEKDGTDRTRLSAPLRKERPDDGDITSPKIKLQVVKEEETHGANIADTGTRSLNKCFVSESRGGGDDAVEAEQGHKSKDLRENVGMSPPSTFFHISKKVRSDRDRGRREERCDKATPEHSYGNELVKAGGRSEMSDFDGTVKKAKVDGNNEAMDEVKYSRDLLSRNTDTSVPHGNERGFNKVSTDGDECDMEEGELEPEIHSMVKLSELVAACIAIPNNKVGEDDDLKNSAAPVHAEKGKEACESILRVVSEGEKQLTANGDKSHSVRVEIDENCDDGDLSTPSPDKKEKNQRVTTEEDIINLQPKGMSTPESVAKVFEPGMKAKGGLTFDLLDARTETKSWNLNSTEKGYKELTLSLFTEPVEGGTQDESSEPKGHMGTSQSTVKEQIGRQIENGLNSELGLVRPHLGEESSQHLGHKQKKLKMESLQLSLALPGTPAAAAGSMPRGLVEPERSFQSLNHTQTQTQNFSQSQTYTNSDGFTTSFSFSQSQSFIHNPSCSLNCTSLENQELSCGGSRQVSQGTEQMSHRSWPAFSGNEQMSNGMHTVTSLSHDKSKHRRGVPLYQRVLQNGNIHQGFPSVTGSNRSTGSNHLSQKSLHFGQRMQEAPKIIDSSSQDLEGSVRQTSTHRDIMERVRQQKAWFASKQQAMSGEHPSEPNASQNRERLRDMPATNAKGPNSAGNDDDVAGERNVSTSDRVGLHEITTEPVSVMAQKLQELPDSFLEGLKGVAKGILGSFEKRDEFIALQENIRRRTDLTEDSLLRAHRSQLEILVALKTGMQAFVEEGTKPQTYKALIEIFLQTRCRNLACQKILPVGGCRCTICSKRSGFCHECMCVVCLKFDLDHQSCRWVGCGTCLHWCHTDCALRMSHIAPSGSGQSASASCNLEMHYHCVACSYKSRLFGFVKDVFHECAGGWSAETLAKELDCVRRIFHESEDMNGKQLCWKAEQMLLKLENKVEAAEVCRSMLRFFNEGDAELDGACAPNRKSSLKSNDASAQIGDPSREMVPKATLGSGGKLLDLNKARTVLQTYERKFEGKRTEAAELEYDRARKRAEIEDIESVVRIKQAEAKMFQVRADEAHQEAGGLQRIISVKREKIDEDYACKYAKLRLNEAEERQQKRFEELRVLENAQQDFQKMKIRMEAEIKELMLKMEMAKRQFA